MKWIAITDRLPKDDPNASNVFITCDKDGFVYGSSNYFGGGSMEKDGFYKLVNGEWKYDKDVQYWMPLPKPPKKGVKSALDERLEQYNNFLNVEYFGAGFDNEDIENFNKLNPLEY